METDVAAEGREGFTPETDKGLKGGAIGLLSSVVIGVSSTAPAYSLAASLGFVAMVAGMGFQVARHHHRGLHPDAAHSGRVLLSEQSRPRLRHDVHVDRAGLWPSLGLGHGLGHGGGRHHRHGEPGADHGLVFLLALRTR